MVFSGFIITYNRSNLILDSISKVLSQSVSPDFLWIIDNSSDSLTLEAVDSLKSKKVKYHHMGSNAGPAGAAAKGLELCAADKADWIYWGDDDDPPTDPLIFEELFSIINFLPNNVKVGQVGLVGQLFDTQKGKIKRIENEVLNREFVLVDNIAGNQIKIINSNVVASNLLPNPKLFFGFEELDFDLKMKNRGFLSFISGELMFKQRVKYNTLNKTSNFNKHYQNNENWRDFYSNRNLLYILWINQMYLGFFNRLTVLLVKPIFNLRYGLKSFFSQVKFALRVFVGFLKLLNA
ncbi:glycosyltransferase [Belliella marina]|uniref:Glycosyltransferase n=1 Tax=Belliella marina TaxID=1644146 RepID=A0ABW4VS12_9BACT